MSSPAVVVRGVQTPRLSLAPDGDAADADDAAFLTDGYGLTPDPWQMLVLQAWLSRRPDGRWASLTCGLSVPRQNGKNGLIEIRELFGMVALGEKFLHTAHEVKTARKAFLRLRSFFDNPRRFPELRDMVAEIRKTNGQEAIVLTNGGSVEFVARSSGSGRGFTVDTLVMDEAQDLGEEHLEALMPTTAAAPLGNPQWIMTGTPPKDGKGDVFARTRTDALTDGGGRLCWHEWSADPGCDLDSAEALAQANPGIGLRLQVDVCDGERSRLSDQGYARERLGMWQQVRGQWVIPRDSWDTAGDLQSVADDRFALGVEASPDLAWASIALAGQRPDGAWHVELAERQEGTDWVVPTVRKLLDANPGKIRAVVADAGSPTKALFEGLTAAKVRVTAPKVAELGTGCTQLLNGIVTGAVRHTKQGQMDAAVAAAGKRALGDTGMWVWSRRSASSDITPIQAATLALIGAQQKTVKRPSGTGERKTQKRRVVIA